MQITEIKEAYLLTNDKAQMDRQAIHQFLAYESYWAKNIPFETVNTAIENSLNFGVFHAGKQMAYARVITDFATFAYLCDVFVLADFRRQGIGEWLINTVMAYPPLLGLRRWMLMTQDAHELYAKCGWRVVLRPERCMEKHNPDIYKS